MNKIKGIFYNSYIYNFYSNVILKIPLFKIFIDVDYLILKIGESFLYNKIYNICKKVLSKLTKINININYLSIVFLIIYAVIFFDINESNIKCIILTLVLIYILKNKDNDFFTVSVISFIFIFIIRKYGAESVAYEGFSLWCSGSAFYITSKIIRKDNVIYFLKFVHFINLFNCLIAILSEKNAFYGKITLYLLPFSLTYLVLKYKKIKRLIIFALTILISVLTGIRGGGAIISGIALEIVLFSALYSPKYIFLAFLVTPAAITALINRILILRKEFILSGITLDNIIMVSLRYINNGLKGDVLTLGKTITQNTFMQLENISLGEQFFIYTILIFVLITVLFLGRYIFRLIRRTVLLYGEKSGSNNALITGAISFFLGTSFTALLSSLSGSINTMLVYWILLGVIKSFHK